MERLVRPNTNLIVKRDVVEIEGERKLYNYTFEEVPAGSNNEAPADGAEASVPDERS